MLILLMLVSWWVSPRRILSLVGKDASHADADSASSASAAVAVMMSAATVPIPKSNDDSDDSEKRGGTIDEMVDRISNRIMVVRKDSHEVRDGAFLAMVMICDY